MSPSPSRSARARRLLFFLFSLGVTIGVFSILFRHIAWRDVQKLIVEIDPRWVGVFLCFSFLQLILRTLRYRMLLRSSGQPVRSLALFLVVVVRGLCVDMLPARMGELVYIFLLRTRLGLELGAASASFALAFVFDILALAPLLALAALAMVGAGDLSPMVLLGGGAVLLTASVAVIALMRPGLRLLERLLRPWRERDRRWAVSATTLLTDTRASLELASGFGMTWRLFGYSVGVRLTKYAALYALALALLLPQGLSRETASFFRFFPGLVAGEMAASLPVSGIGGFGAYEGTLSMVMIWMGFAKDTAAALAVSHRLLTQLYGLALGLGALFLLSLPCFALRQAPPIPPASAG